MASAVRKEEGSAGGTVGPKGRLMLAGGFRTFDGQEGCCPSLVRSVSRSSVITKHQDVLGPMLGAKGQK